ncbi:hypothetical protein GN157_11975 [Flavobacterium rakeshii]|uniref:Uncharacterized protein n=1 Tax=Flavobacterium rakeshii TaxID=1038845 RepID=A0A6N8HFD3_9FLAO|nr:hypothetical protein [Flavobacterium rakeshii]MUV04427.1 hypothetical protein [Flavobacterium rakeshii]
MATINSLGDVQRCIKKWQSILTNETEVMNCFNQGNSINYVNKYDFAQLGNTNLHVYPGVDTDGKFYMFLLPAALDVPNVSSIQFSAFTVCKVEPNLGDSNQIPTQEAILRIDTWKKDYGAWTKNQIQKKSVTGGIFEAFHMPASYMIQSDKYITYLGLQTDASAATGLTADLITTDIKYANVYYDTVMPVPPFDKINFNLL